MKSLAENIKYYRKKSRLTQKDLAKLLNISYTSISAWEVGRNKPLMDNIEKMATIFGISKSQLLGDELLEENQTDPQKEKLISNYNAMNDENKKELVNVSIEMLEEQKQAEIIQMDNKYIDVARQAVAFDGKEFSDDEIRAIAAVLKENFKSDDF